jgi:hypothetical protein
VSAAAARVVAREGHLDRGQLGALIRLLLGQGLRGGVDPSTGVRGNPLRQLMFSMSILGLTFTPNAWRCTDLPAYLVLLFAAVLTMVLLAIVPETQEVRERHVEILGSKPIARRTLFAARGAMLAVLASLIATAFSLIPLTAGGLRFSAPWPRLLLIYACLVAGAFVSAVTGLLLVTLGLRLWPPERVRRLSQTTLVLFLVGMTVVSILATPMLTSRYAAGATFSAGGALELLPSTWFVRLAVGGGPHPVAAGAGALMLLALAIVLGLGYGLDRLLPSFAESAPVPMAHATSPLACRFLRTLRRAPILGRLCLPAASGSIAEAIVLSARREEVSRTRDLGSHLMAAVFFVLSFSVVPPLVAGSLFLYLAIAAAIEGARAARQSSTPAASWIFVATPLRPSEIVRGIEAAVFLRSAALPLLLLFVLTLRQHPPALAVLLAVGYLASVRVALTAMVAVDPGPPLSRETVVSSFVGVAGAFVLGGTIVFVSQVLALVASRFGWMGLALVAILDAGALTLAWMSGLWASWRLERASAAA